MFLSNIYFYILFNYRVCDLLDYTAEELTGRSLYSLIHGQDVMQIRKCHLDCELINFIIIL